MANKLVERTLVGVLMIAIFLACLLHPMVFMAAMVFAIVVMHVEYYDMAVGRGAYHAEKLLVTLASVMLFVTAYMWMLGICNPEWMLLSLIPMYAAFAALIFNRHERGDVRKTEELLFPLLYVGLASTIGSALLVAGPQEFNATLYLAIFILIWSNDVGAYVLGMALGQKPDSRKLCPDISPKKSWAGVWGGAFFVAMAAVILRLAGWLPMGWLHVAVVAVIVLVCGILGDLFESLIKRHFGVKDSGKIMPGHGGLLDRFDGALMVLPVVAIYLLLTGII